MTEATFGLTVVLLPGRLVLPGTVHGRAVGDAPAHAGELVDLVNDGVRTIVVSAAASRWLRLDDADARRLFLVLARAAGWVVEPEDGAGWLWRCRRSNGPATSVVLLADDVHGYCGPFAGDVDDVELVAGLAAYADATGVCFGPSVGSTAERLLLATHPRRRGGTRLDVRPLMPPTMGDVAETATVWRADPTLFEREEFEGHWVHWYDANANYLGAYQAAVLGLGEPEQVGDVAALLEQRYLPPGVWTATLPGHEGGLPLPWSTRAGAHMSPTIERARELGVDVAKLVTEAWVWPRQSRFCAPFGERCRDARAQLLETAQRPGHALALAAVGATYQRLHGRFGAGFRAGTASPWARPDWMHTIRAVARCNFDRRILGLQQLPFAVDVDAAYYVTREEDPVAYAQRIGLPLGRRASLGRFRHAGSVFVTDDVAFGLCEAHSAAATRDVLRIAAVDVDAAVARLHDPALAGRVGVLHPASPPPDVDGLVDGELEELAAALAALEI